jgi:hypothetical protein
MTDRRQVAHSAQQSDDGDIRWTLNEIERSTREILTALIHTWMLGSNLLQLNDVLRDRKLTPEQAKVREHFQADLTLVAEFISQRTRHFPPAALARFVVEQDQLLELNGRGFSADKEVLNFFLSRWSPWTTDSHLAV